VPQNSSLPIWGCCQIFLFKTGCREPKKVENTAVEDDMKEWMNEIDNFFVEFIYISFHLCYTWAENSLENTFFTGYYEQKIVWRRKGCFQPPAKDTNKTVTDVKKKLVFYNPQNIKCIYFQNKLFVLKKCYYFKSIYVSMLSVFFCFRRRPIFNPLPLHVKMVKKRQKQNQNLKTA